MPRVFLSPSVQKYNPYINGGNEAFFMNLLTDAMIPYLTFLGITVKRSMPGQSLREAISYSNEEPYALHLALHTTAAPCHIAGLERGAEVYYFASSPNGKRAADIFAGHYQKVYPVYKRVKIIPSSSLLELRETTATAILIQLAYHDNKEDADWLCSHMEEITDNLVFSIMQCLELPANL